MSPSLEEQLKVLQVSYVKKIPKKLEDMESSWAALKQQSTEKNLGDFYCLVHKITGSGATYGFKQISETARPLEVLLNEKRENFSSLNVQDKSKIDSLFADLKKVCNEIYKNF